MVRLDMFAEYGVEALATSTTTQEDTPATRDSKMKQFWRRLKYDVGSAEYHQFSALEDRSLHDWLELKRKYGPKGQLLVTFGSSERGFKANILTQSETVAVGYGRSA